MPALKTRLKWELNTAEGGLTMSRTPKKTSKAKTAATGNQPSTRHRDTAGDVLLPLLGAQLEPVEPVYADGTGNPLRSLPCDENGNVFLPLLGDEDEAPAPGNNDHHTLPTKEIEMKNQKYFFSYVDGANCIYLRVANPKSGIHDLVRKTSTSSLTREIETVPLTCQLWLSSDGNIEHRKPVLTLENVPLALFSTKATNRIIKAAINCHENSNKIVFKTQKALRAFIKL